MVNYKFSDYTKNMYLSRKSKVWSYLNNMRLKRIVKLLDRYDYNLGNVIEFGSFDLYYITTILKFMNDKGCKNYTFTDKYRPDVEEWVNHNLPLLNNNKGNKINFSMVYSWGENIDKVIKGKFDSAFVFETIEHVMDEKKVINNIGGIIKPGGFVFVSVPKEFGLMFFIKEMGRFLLLGHRSYTLKEILYSTFGRVDKVDRIPGGHKGYDYRNTISWFEGRGFSLVERVYYPFRFCAYGVVLKFKME